MSPDEARRAGRASRSAPPRSLAVAAPRRARLPALEDLLQDLRFAARLIAARNAGSRRRRSSPSRSASAPTRWASPSSTPRSFAGFNFERAEQLHAISWRPTRAAACRPRCAISRTGARNRSRSRTWRPTRSAPSTSATTTPRPNRRRAASVTANLFDVLRQRPLLGRAFAAGEDRRGADPVVDHRLRHLDEPLRQRSRRDRPHPPDQRHARRTIVGVMPERMKFPDNSELWVPFVPTDAQLTRDVAAAGRVRPPGRRRQPRAGRRREIDGIARADQPAHPDQTKNVVGGQVETLHRAIPGRRGAPDVHHRDGRGHLRAADRLRQRRQPAAVARDVSLARSRRPLLARRHALAHRPAAADRERRAVAAWAASVGLALAAFGVRAFDAAMQMSQPPYWLRFTIDYRVLAYVAGICVATGVIFGLAPALQVSRENQHDTLKEGGARHRRQPPRRPVRQRPGGRRARADHRAALRRRADAAQLHRALCRRSGLRGRRPDAHAHAAAAVEATRRADVAARFFDQLVPRLEADSRRRAGGDHHRACRRSITRSARFEIDGRPRKSMTIGGRLSARSRSRRATSRCSASPVARGRDISRHRRRGRRRERRHQPDDGRPLLPGRRSDRPAHPLRARVTTSPAPRRSRGAPSSASRDVSCRDRQTMRFASAVVYLPFRQAPPRTSSLLIRSALPPASVMAAVRSVVQSIDRRSAGVHHRDRRGRLCERAVRSTGSSPRCSPCSRRSGSCCRRSASTASSPTP